jgi:hypothetical protein
MQNSRKFIGGGALSVAAAVALSLWNARPAQAQSFVFNPNDIVVSVEGDGSNTGSYIDNQAAPLTLYQYAVSGTAAATAAGSLELPQTAGAGAGGNSAISGEYGSSSEASLQLSGNGQYLTLMGYGINADTYNSTYDVNGTGTALGQSPNTAAGGANVARVVALIGADGSVNTSTAISGVFSENNPRGAYTANGTSFYISGQGNFPDTTAGVFYTTLGCTSASCLTAITGADTTSSGTPANQDTRFVTVYNNTLYVSVDSKAGANSKTREFIGSLGTPPSTTLYNSAAGPTQLPGFGSAGQSSSGNTINITASNGNGVNAAGQTVNLSPENFFFANADTLYVADSGDPKVTGSKGDGGLQKWTLNTSTGNWGLDYTLSANLGLVANTSATGTSGLYGLTGKVVGNNVELFATSFSLTDTGATYLYGISDSLNATSESGEAFTQLAAAPADSDFKGVSFAPASPVPLPASTWLMLSGLGGLAAFTRKRRH